MTSIDEFRKALRTGKLTDAFVLAMSKAHHLNITTSIAFPEQNYPQSATSSAALIHRLRTRLNLVEGTIDNEIDVQFLDHPLYRQVQQFHRQQVNQGHHTIAQNLETLQQMFRLLATLQKQQIEGNYREFSWLDEASKSLNEKALPQQPPSGIATNDTASKTTEEVSPPVKTVNSNISDSLVMSASVESDLEEQEKQENERESTAIKSTGSETKAYLLSLEDLEIENEEVIPTQEEDWGDWLEEDDDVALIDLDALEGEDELEDWQEGKEDSLDNNKQ